MDRKIEVGLYHFLKITPLHPLRLNQAEQMMCEGLNATGNLN